MWDDEIHITFNSFTNSQIWTGTLEKTTDSTIKIQTTKKPSNKWPKITTENQKINSYVSPSNTLLYTIIAILTWIIIAGWLMLIKKNKSSKMPK
jgi:heme A synthase